jgi:hypothetical protein
MSGNYVSNCRQQVSVERLAYNTITRRLFLLEIRLKKHLEWLALRPNPLIPEDHGNIVGLLVTAGTSLAATVDTFYHLLLPEVLGDPAHARGGEIVVSCLYASEAAKALVTRLHIHKT